MAKRRNKKEETHSFWEIALGLICALIFIVGLVTLWIVAAEKMDDLDKYISSIDHAVADVDSLKSDYSDLDSRMYNVEKILKIKNEPRW